MRTRNMVWLHCAYANPTTTGRIRIHVLEILWIEQMAMSDCNEKYTVCPSRICYSCTRITITDGGDIHGAIQWYCCCCVCGCSSQLAGKSYVCTYRVECFFHNGSNSLTFWIRIDSEVIDSAMYGRWRKLATWMTIKHTIFSQHKL